MRGIYLQLKQCYSAHDYLIVHMIILTVHILTVKIILRQVRIFISIFYVLNLHITLKFFIETHCSAQTRTRMGCLRKSPRVELIPTVD